MEGKEKEAWEFQVLTQNLQQPPMPEPLRTLNQLRQWNTLYWPGGLGAQPYLFLMECEAVIKGENALASRRKANLEALLKYLEGQVKAGKA